MCREAGLPPQVGFSRYANKIACTGHRLWYAFPQLFSFVRLQKFYDDDSGERTRLSRYFYFRVDFYLHRGAGCRDMRAGAGSLPEAPGTGQRVDDIAFYSRCVSVAAGNSALSRAPFHRPQRREFLRYIQCLNPKYKLPSRLSRQPQLSGMPFLL